MTHYSSGTGTPSTEAIIEASRAFMAAARQTSTLYELTAEYTRILDVLEDPEANADALELELDAIAGLITRKAENIGGLISHLEHIAEARRVEYRRLRERAQADEAHAQRLRDYLFRHMQELGSPRIETARFTFSIRTNPPAVEIVDLALVPEAFIKPRVVTAEDVSKTAIKDAWKDTGEIPPGVDIVRRQRLEIR
jgi:hypothetical protein